MPEASSSSTAFSRIYTVNGPSTTSSSSLPTWITTKARPKGGPSNHRKRSRTQHTLGQLELIQDFTFPQSAIRIKLTDDGEHAVGTGTYKPMMKVWDLNQLTVKFERVTDAENVDFVMLSRDWTKSLHLQADRSLQLHTQGGLHHTVRLPTYGRCLTYHSPSCEALVGATGREIFRFNLDEGRYMMPLVVGNGGGNIASTKNASADDIDGVNCIDVDKNHGLWSFGLDGASKGHVEFWDPRSRSSLTSLHLPTTSLKPTFSDSPASPYLSVTALQSHPTDGLSLAVGTSTGHTLLYDLRSPRPFAVKDQGYGEAVKNVSWLNNSDGSVSNLVSADSKVIKVWDKGVPGENLFSLHPHAPVLDLCPLPGTGLLLAALDSPQMSAYYVPELGPAPRWASFLDGVTEELEDDVEVGGAGSSKGAYKDYKFVDRKELDSLGLSHLVGTSTLKPYMHGYFLSLKLYTTARLVSNPSSYTEHREKIVESKIAAQQESRIRARKQQPKVNKALAERVRKQEEREEAREARRRERKGLAVDEVEEEEQDEGEEDEEAGDRPEKRTKGTTNILQDPRFKELWENPDFEVDEQSREYELLNPGSVHAAKRQKTAVEEEDEESDRASSDGLSHSDSEEASDKDGDESPDSDEEGELRPRNFSWVDKDEYAQRQKVLSRPRLVAGDDDDEDGSSRRSKGSTFGQRLRQGDRDSAASSRRSKQRDDGILTSKRTGDGGMEMSFVPKAGGGRGEDDLNVDYVPQKKDATGEDGGKKAGDKRVEKFAAGLEKGGYRGVADGQREVSEEERKGRASRRHPGRSASKNVFRGL